MAGNIGEVHAFGQSSDWEHADASAGPPDDADAAARVERQAADGRYQAFASDGAPVDPCYAFDAPDHDFDRCVRERPAKQVLFERQGSDVEAIEPPDIQQGQLGDCHLLAPLGALAATPRGRALIQNAVVENRNDKGEVVSWTVTLHQPEPHVFGSTTFRDVPVTVDGQYVVGHARIRPGGSEVWPLVVEKAYAQYAGGYNKISRGGVPADVMPVLTGREATYVSLGWSNRWFGGYGADALQTDLAKGKMVVLSTKPGIGGNTGPDATPADRQANANAHGLIGDHAYYVAGTEQVGGKLLVKLGNPWGDEQPDLVPFDELTTWFSGVSVGSVP